MLWGTATRQAPRDVPSNTWRKEAHHTETGAAGSFHSCRLRRCEIVVQVSPESMFMVAELCHGGSLRDVVRDQMVSFSRVGVFFRHRSAQPFCGVTQRYSYSAEGSRKGIIVGHHPA